MSASVEFRSAAFPKYPNEDAELVNANLWGKRLAEFIRDHLPKHGIATQDILCEDWGWLVQVKNDGFPLWIGCGVMDGPDSDDEDGVSSPHGSAGDGITEFRVFVEAEPGLVQRWLKQVDTKPAIQRVLDGLRRMISSSPDIHDVKWTE